jgi:hypothetical protein
MAEDLLLLLLLLLLLPLPLPLPLLLPFPSLLSSKSPPSVPKWNSEKIKFKTVACFSRHKISHATHHQPPQIHHEFTTKKPRKNTRISETPLKKASKNAKKSPGNRRNFFCKISKN